MRHESSAFYPAGDAESGLRRDQRSFLDRANISFGLPSLFYASLRDPRVFEAVVGRPLDACDWERATIHGFRLGIVNAGTGFPGLFPASGPDAGGVVCVIVHDLSRFEQTMVAWYEWDEYLLRRIPLADGRSAQVFVPNLEAIRAEHGRFDIDPWSFQAWQRSEVDRAVVNARDWMAQRPADAALMRAGCFPSVESSAGGRAAG